MKLGILTEFEGMHNDYVKACEELGVNYEIVDIISSDWISKISGSSCDGFLVRPSCKSDVHKRMYDERLYFINRILKKPIYPSYDEVIIYENKRNMYYWLEFNKIPKPKTWVFYESKEAMSFTESYEAYPLVFKPNTGNAGRGIKFLKNGRQAGKLIRQVFTRYRFFNRGFTKWYKTRYGISYPIMDDRQFNNVLFQEKVDIQHEWRGVKIGESYFAHKKLEGGNGLHSGSGLADYGNPPLRVMDFIKFVCDFGNFSSMDIDLFEDREGNFLVNELHTVFGSKIKPYQMCVDGKPGRYIYEDGKWDFEEGVFNQNNSCNLRVSDFIDILKNNHMAIL